MIDNTAFYKLSYGMYIISATCEGKKNAQIANTVFQITSDPQLLAVSINKQNLTHKYIQKGKIIGVSVLSEEAPMDLIGKLGFKSGRDGDKFEGTAYITGETGVPVVTDSIVSYFELEVEKEVDVLTHTIFIGKVVNAQVLQDKDQMTYKYYQDVKRGKSPKTAPTYIASKAEEVTEAKEESGLSKYQCSICGYIYDPAVGDDKGNIAAGTSFENLPNDWTCPICGMPKDKFKQI